MFSSYCSWCVSLLILQASSFKPWYDPSLVWNVTPRWLRSSLFSHFLEAAFNAPTPPTYYGTYVGLTRELRSCSGPPAGKCNQARYILLVALRTTYTADGYDTAIHCLTSCIWDKVSDIQIRPMTQPSHAHLSAKNTANVTRNLEKNVSSPGFPPACRLGPSCG